MTAGKGRVAHPSGLDSRVPHFFRLWKSGDGNLGTDGTFSSLIRESCWCISFEQIFAVRTFLSAGSHSKLRASKQSQQSSHFCSTWNILVGLIHRRSNAEPAPCSTWNILNAAGASDFFLATNQCAGLMQEPSESFITPIKLLTDRFLAGTRRRGKASRSATRAVRSCGRVSGGSGCRRGRPVR